MDPVASTTAAGSNATADTKSDTKTSAKQKLTAFEDELTKAGAKVKPVKGHAFEKVVGGKHDGEFINTSGNARNAELFSLVERDGHTFHVYGTGKDRKIFEVGGKNDTGGTPAKS